MRSDVLIRWLRISAAVGLSLATTVPSLSADPLTVTSGRFSVVWDDPTFFQFAGTDGFVLNAVSLRVPVSPQQACHPREGGCAPGTSLDLGAVAGGDATGWFTPFTLGRMTLVSSVNGTQYGPFSHPDEATQLAGTFQFDAPTIVLPPILNAGVPGEFMAPFVFSGAASGFAPDDVDMTSPLFSVTLAGRGTANVQFETDNGTYHSASVRYTFQDAAPVPEPATLTLLSAGLAGVVVRARRRKAGRLADRAGLTD
jgi:hypothetical protein